MSRLTTPDARPSSRSTSHVQKALDDADIRYHGARPLRTQLNKVFPSHWSFMLGEAALYSFIVLLLSGVYLTLFFDPSMAETVYQGVYEKLRGVPMSMAYATTLDISFEVRGGLLIRQIHHWAALLFLFAMMLHMMRVFFTGAFRKPREVNWIIGVLLLILGMAEGFLGYSLPDDLLSGTGLRAVSAFILSIPVIGTWTHWAVFGGDYPGEIIIPRFYSLHILLMPGIILALIAVHVALVWFQKHTQFPRPAKATENNVIGTAHPAELRGQGRRLLRRRVRHHRDHGRGVPDQPDLEPGAVQPVPGVGRRAARLLHGLPRRHGPNMAQLGDPKPVRALHGSGRVLPVDPRRHRLMMIVVIAYPYIEKAFTKDNAIHNLLQRPRDVPVRTALGVAFMTFYIVNLINGANDLFAFKLDISLNVMTWVGPGALDHRPGDRLRGDLPDLPGPAALGPGGAGARHRDRA